MVIRKNIYCLIALIFLSSCAHKDNLRLVKVSYDNLENWDAENYIAAAAAFSKSCKSYDKNGWQRFIKSHKIEFDEFTYKKTCKLAQQDFVSNYDAKIFFENNFSPYLVTNNSISTGLFTGYYEPIINVAKIPSKKYKYPIYAAPSNLDKIVPYFSREQIEFGALKNLGLDIAYTDDAVELFFLHIQGSGILKFNDGTMQRVSYGGKNSHKYYSIGKYFLEQGYKASEINADFIKEKLKNNHHQAFNIMYLNPSYVFFKLSDKNYTVGAQGTELTPERSLAIDRRYFPLGAVFWLSLQNNNDNSYNDFNKIVISQDSGAAIKGVVRGDIFFGNHKKSKSYASYMKAQGEYFVLLPKSNVDYAN